jgi:hypothetical protein
MKRSRQRPAEKPRVHIIGEPTQADYDQLADTLLAVAGEVAAAEDRIKREAIAAIERGDSTTALALLRRWQSEPPTEIAKSLERNET